MIGLYEVFRAGSLFLKLINAAILVYCILSWIMPRTQVFEFLARFIQPFVAPFRRLSFRLMARFNIPLDLSCWFAMIGYGLLDRLWWRLFYLLLRVMR